MISELYKDNPKSKVVADDTLTVDQAIKHKAGFIVRGNRKVKDVEYEETISDINRQLANIETILLFTEPELTAVSSTIVRELLTYGKDVSMFLPEGMKIDQSNLRSPREADELYLLYLICLYKSDYQPKN